MSRYRTEARELLKKFPDGLTASDIAKFMELNSATNVTTALKSMGDAYIDRWEKRRNGNLAAVWCLASVPEDCPRPDYSESHKRRLRREHESADVLQ